MDSRIKTKLRQYSLTAGVVVLLAACGGGGPAETGTPDGEKVVIFIPVKYAVGGTVSGLGAGAVLTLSLGSEKLTVGANGNFAFANKIETGGAYSVSASAPAGYTCRVSEAAGVVGAADVSKIAVACAPVVLAGAVSTMQTPLAMTGDGAGNLYVVDSRMASVLKFSAAGAMSVFAGDTGQPGYADGPGATARFGFGRGDVVADAQGNVLVVDGCNNVIRKINPDGAVSTLAGSVFRTCRIETIASPSGPADGVGSQAQFALPNKMISDGAGGGLVLELFNRGMVRKVSATGVVTSQYWRNPNTTEGDLRFTTLARGSDATLYLSDSRGRIWKDVGGVLVHLAGQTSTGGAAVDGSALAARFSSIRAMVAAPGGDLYVADSNQIRKVTPAGVVSTVAGTAAGLGTINAMTLDATGIVVLDARMAGLRRVGFDGVVSTLPGTSGAAESVDGVGGAARFASMGSLAADADGNLYTVDPNRHSVRKTTPDGSVTTIAGKAGFRGVLDGALDTAWFELPHTIAAGREGVLWVAQSQGLRKIQNGMVSTVSPLQDISDMTLDTDGNPIVVDQSFQVVRITPVGTATVLVTPAHVTALLKNADAGFSPAGMVADTAGNLYIADGATSVVFKLTKSGELSVFAGTPFNDVGDLDGPPGKATFGFYDYAFMTIDDKGNLYLSGQGKVRMISPAGVVSTPNLGWGNASVTALAFAKGKLYGMTRYAVLQTWLP